MDPLTAAVTHKVETEEKTESHETDALVAATGVEDLTSVEFIDKEPLVTSTTTTEVFIFCSYGNSFADHVFN